MPVFSTHTWGVCVQAVRGDAAASHAKGLTGARPESRPLRPVLNLNVGPPRELASEAGARSGSVVPSALRGEPASRPVLYPRGAGLSACALPCWQPACTRPPPSQALKALLKLLCCYKQPRSEVGLTRPPTWPAKLRQVSAQRGDMPAEPPLLSWEQMDAP